MQPAFDVVNIAHRGARSLAPENTIAAARKALSMGADMWELDVNLTADGELVVLHDDTLERTSNVRQLFPDRAPWRVCDFTLDELYRLDFGSWYEEQDPFGQIAAGAVLPEEMEDYKGETIPTLRDALLFTRENHWRVNVEIKDLTGTPGDGVVVQKVLALIAELGMTGQVLLSSFNHAYLEQSRKIGAAIPLAALVETPVADPTGLLERLGAVALNPDARMVTPEMVHTLRSQGYDVYVWTVNDEATMRSLVRTGVSGIITDFPQILYSIMHI